MPCSADRKAPSHGWSLPKSSDTPKLSGTVSGGAVAADGEEAGSADCATADGGTSRRLSECSAARAVAVAPAPRLMRASSAAIAKPRGARDDCNRLSGEGRGQLIPKPEPRIVGRT